MAVLSLVLLAPGYEQIRTVTGPATETLVQAVPYLERT